MYGKILQLLKATIFPVFIVTGLALSPLPVSADFAEDFSTLDDWKLYAQNDGQWTNTTWSLADGVLNSSKPIIDYEVINHACYNTGYDNGIWNFDFYGPDIPFVWGFRISVDPDFVTGEPGQEGAPHWTNPSSTQVVIKVGLTKNNKLDSSPPYIDISQLVNNETFTFGFASVNESYSLSQDQIRGWHHVQIEKNDTYATGLIDGENAIEGKLFPIADTEYSWICIWGLWGTGIAFDNITITDLPYTPGLSNNDDMDFPQAAMIASVVIVSTTAITIGGRSYIKKKHIKKAIEQRRLNLEKIKNVNHEFELSDPSIYALAIGANRVDDYYTDERFKELIPSEMLAYRYLMHPIRLTIMKLLNSEGQMRSIDIKHVVDISWTEYSNHMKSLEKNGYVEVQNDFSDQGNVIQVVYILEFGRKQFELLFGLLQQFVAKSSPYEYLMYAKANLRDIHMYPDETGLE